MAYCKYCGRKLKAKEKCNCLEEKQAKKEKQKQEKMDFVKKGLFYLQNMYKKPVDTLKQVTKISKKKMIPYFLLVLLSFFFLDICFDNTFFGVFRSFFRFSFYKRCFFDLFYLVLVYLMIGFAIYLVTRFIKKEEKLSLQGSYAFLLGITLLIVPVNFIASFLSLLGGESLASFLLMAIVIYSTFLFFTSYGSILELEENKKPIIGFSLCLLALFLICFGLFLCFFFFGLGDVTPYWL